MGPIPKKSYISLVDIGLAKVTRSAFWDPVPYLF